MSRRSMFVSLIALLGAGALLLSAGSPASAQFRGGMRDLAQPEVDSAELERYDEILDLSEGQEAVAEDLLVTYQREVEELREEIQAVAEAARAEWEETRDRSIWFDFRDAMEPFEQRKERLNEAFLDDLRLVLTPEQDERWEEAMHMRRRMRTLDDDGLVSGENVDLVETVRSIDLPEETRQTVRPVLRQYASDLDRVLVKRNETYEESQEQGLQLFREGNFDEIEKLFDEARESAIAVRDVNRRYARQIQTMLEAEQAERFEREFKERSFPNVYRETQGQTALNTVAQFEDLTSDQQTQIEQIRASYERELEAINAKHEEAIEERELNRSARDMFGRGRWDRRGDDELGELRAERRELDERVIDRVRRVLTDAQAQRLPERPSTDWRDAGRRSREG